MARILRTKPKGQKSDSPNPSSRLARCAAQKTGLDNAAGCPEGVCRLAIIYAP